MLNRQTKRILTAANKFFKASTASRWLFLLSLVISTAIAPFVSYTISVQAMTEGDLRDILSGSAFYQKDGCNSTPTVGVSGPGLTEIDGFKLPAYHGTTGNEDPIVDDQGHIAVGATNYDAAGNYVSGGTISGETVSWGSQIANLPANQKQAFKDYYITMRWTYVSWDWAGTSHPADSKQAAWFAGRVPLVLVTNPKTGKSIVAAALESGPAPWVGVDSTSNNIPKQGWTNPQIGTPETYTGLVSGLPKKARVALGLSDSDAGYASGNKVDLIYSWAPDQSATPGPIDLVQTLSDADLASSEAATVSNNCNPAANGIVAGNIVQTAAGLAWPDYRDDRGAEKADATPAYQEAMPKYNGALSSSTQPFSDCGIFVSTVMRASGIDPNYPKADTGAMAPYLRAHPEKYIIVEDITDTSKLRPGDILIISDPAGSGLGHTLIYTGPQQGKDTDGYEAALYSHVPQAAHSIAQINYANNKGGTYFAARVIK